MAQEKSRAMPMTAERALCSTVLVISRQIASMRLAMTARLRALRRSSFAAAAALDAAADAAGDESFMAWHALLNLAWSASLACCVSAQPRRPAWRGESPVARLPARLLVTRSLGA